MLELNLVRQNWNREKEISSKSFQVFLTIYMAMNKENKNLSRNRKRITERKIKMDAKMKSLLNKIESERKNKNKNIDKIKNLEKELVKIKYAINPNKLQSELKELTKFQVVDTNWHEIKQEMLKDYTNEVEIVGNLKVGNQSRQNSY